MSQPVRTPEEFDRMIRPAPRPQVIWTAEAIGRRIGASADFVRDKLAAVPGSPVRQIGGRYCALETDLIDFFRADREKW